MARRLANGNKKRQRIVDVDSGGADLGPAAGMGHTVKTGSVGKKGQSHPHGEGSGGTKCPGAHPHAPNKSGTRKENAGKRKEEEKHCDPNWRKWKSPV